MLSKKERRHIGGSFHSHRHAPCGVKVATTDTTQQIAPSAHRVGDVTCSACLCSREMIGFRVGGLFHAMRDFRNGCRVSISFNIVEIELLVLVEHLPPSLRDKLDVARDVYNRGRK